MYAFSEMIDMGLKEGQTWPSAAHKAVATVALIGNSRIVSCSLLRDQVEIINAIPDTDIKFVTFDDLSHLGILL